MINVFNRDDEWQVWSDTEVTPGDGRCVGVGKTNTEALANACKELAADFIQANDLWHQFRKKATKPLKP